jgi:hypothetical protein
MKLQSYVERHNRSLKIFGLEQISMDTIAGRENIAKVLKDNLLNIDKQISVLENLQTNRQSNQEISSSLRVMKTDIEETLRELETLPVISSN